MSVNWFGSLRTTLLVTGLIPLAVLSPVLQAQQTLSLPSEADISRLRPPGLPLPALPDFDLRIEAPERSPVPRAVDELRFELRRVDVEGASRFSQAELDALFAPVLGERVALEDVRQATQALEDRYRAQGFFLVRVVVPPQELKDGVILIRVIEGYIEAAYAQGGTPAMRRHAEQLMSGLLDKRPIDLASLERALLTLNDLPGLAGGGVLRPGAALGASELVIDLTDPPPLQTSVNLNNNASNLIGPFGLSVNSTITNPFDHPGRLSAGVSSSLDSKLWAVNAGYSAALGNRGVVGTMSGLRARAKPAGALRDRDLVVDSQLLSGRLRAALLRGRRHSVFVEGGLTLHRAETSGAGSALDQDRRTVLDVGLTWVGSLVERGQTQARLGVVRGIPAFGAFKAGDSRAVFVPDFEPDFVKWTYSLEHTQFLTDRASVLLMMQGQRSSDVLVSGEQIAFGGPLIGRGYDSGAIAGRQGHGALLEWRWTTSGEALRGLAPLQSAQFFVYADTAEVDSVQRIESHGLGVRLSAAHNWQAELMVAKAGKGLQTPPADPRANPRLLMSITKGF